MHNRTHTVPPVQVRSKQVLFSVLMGLNNLQTNTPPPVTFECSETKICPVASVPFVYLPASLHPAWEHRWHGDMAEGYCHPHASVVTLTVVPLGPSRHCGFLPTLLNGYGSHIAVSKFLGTNFRVA